MTFSFSGCVKFCFGFVFFSFLAVHFTHMKMSPQTREIASSQVKVTPWYDASFKY